MALVEPHLERSRFAALGAGWSDLAKADPLAAWKLEFEEWRARILQFRRVEHTLFFENTADEESQRMHRGFLCELIAGGEMLAFEIVRMEGDQPGKAEQKGFVEEFLLNLRSTLQTWHSLIPIADLEHAA
jgi:hypothetical protein